MSCLNHSDKQGLLKNSALFVKRHMHPPAELLQASAPQIYKELRDGYEPASEPRGGASADDWAHFEALWTANAEMSRIAVQ